MRSGHVGRTVGDFSVARYYRDGGYEYARRWCDMNEALEHALVLIASSSARSGTIIRIIITDGGERMTWEWQYGKGMVYPPPTVR